MGEGAQIFGPALGVGEGSIDRVAIILVAGLPAFIVFSWFFDVTSKGVVRTRRIDDDTAETQESRNPVSTASTAVASPGHRGVASRERRPGTVLAVRFRGYLGVSAYLDRDGAEDLLQRLNEVASAVCRRYDGTIHHFSGGEMTLLFGIPVAHEDDTLRAMRAALSLLDGARRVERDLDDHLPGLDAACAVVTGSLVVEGEGDGSGRMTVAGDPLLLAAHLIQSAHPGSILAGAETYRQTRGILRFEELPPVLLEARHDPVDVYRLMSPRRRPTTVHGWEGIQGRLVGRRREMRELDGALEAAREGRAGIVGVVGEAGTGKSRLIQEWKATLDPDEVDWYEGHAYQYTAETPYFPVVDMLSRCFDIDDRDTQEGVREKLRAGVDPLLGEASDAVVWLGSLYELPHPDLEKVQPDLWVARIYDAVFRLLAAFAETKPCVVVIEDLHWADAATMRLLGYLFERFRQPALLLFTYRPPFELESPPSRVFRRLEIANLSSSETEHLIESMLQTDELPDGLGDFVQAKAEGNPFFLGELLNALVESRVLVSRGEGWELERDLGEVTIPTTIEGLVQSRLDRLAPDCRRLLQEASVIGRVVPSDLLREVASEPERLDDQLAELTGVGILHVHRGREGIDYSFNHALTQTVAYGSLLRKDRVAIHERVARSAERLYRGRLPEFYELLALHYQLGASRLKAVDYLVRAGEKSWRRYALEQSNHHFSEAFELLRDEDPDDLAECVLLVDVLNRWAIVYNHLGDFRTLADLLTDHEELARAIAPERPVAAALLFGWLGYALQCREQLERSYHYLDEALQLVGRTGDPAGTAYISAWMARTCVDMGRLDEALEHGHRAERISEDLAPDAKLFRFVYSALGLAYYFRGERAQVDDVATRLLEYGESHGDLRSLLLGHVNRGCSYLIAGQFEESARHFQKGIDVSVDPMYAMYARLMLGVCHASAGALPQAEATLTKVVRFDAEHGFDLLGTTARGMMSIVLLARGEMAEGVRMAEEVVDSYRANGNRYREALQLYLLGRVYLRLVLKEGDGGLGFMAKNVGFLLRSIPQARRKAREYLEAAIRLAREIEAKGVLGQALTDLGRLQRASGNEGAARATLSESVAILEGIEATEYLRDAREALDGRWVSA